MTIATMKDGQDRDERQMRRLLGTANFDGGHSMPAVHELCINEVRRRRIGWSCTALLNNVQAFIHRRLIPTYAYSFNFEFEGSTKACVAIVLAATT